MAFGFGFNKQKTLSAAEKYVQQGKMQNAIAEYEKVLKADPKDLTVSNTVGDLYSRLGDADKATECFKAVGDAYAAQGFTVKAIAMYKKISKLKPSLESVLKLAELYTQQGLFNDARAQYLQVAEEFLKSGELENAVRIFQKILEMDPENTNMRIRLAEVYVRLGKKNEAWQIFSAVAETLRSKGSLTAAEEVLKRMLTLDPGNGYALLMQGRNLLEAGDAEAAIESLQKVSDLDSNPDGLRDLLKAYLKTGRLSDAGTLANKLLTVHNDLTAISTFADALMKAGQYENALQIYDQHADRLLAEDSDKVLENLHSIIGHVQDNPASLEKLLELFQKAGESTHLTEVLELLAHASVQSGDLARARDLYQKLATVEPGNPLHMNSYQQVVSQLGGPSASKLISAEEAAVIVDELEATAPSIHQHYSDAVSLAVRSALTDAELFISYNMPAKALGPLMAALPQAPTDLRLNQRLAALHTRAERFAEAGVCCRTLQTIYSDAGYPEEATRYGELGDRYEERSSAAAHPVIAPADLVAEPPVVGESVPAAASAPWPAARPQIEDASEFAVIAGQEEPAPTAVSSESQETPAEIDLSSEWDDAVTIELDDSPPHIAPPQVAEPASPVAEVAKRDADAVRPATLSKFAEAKLAAEKLEKQKTAEIVEEFRFYIEHGMPEQAQAAFEKLQSFTTDEAVLEQLRAEIAAAPQHAAPAEELPVVVEDISELSVEEAPAEEIAADETAAEEVATEATVAEETVAEEVPGEFAVVEPPTVIEEAAPAAEQLSPEPEVEFAETHSAPELAIEPEVSDGQPVSEQPVSDPVEPAPAVLQEFVADLESSLGDNFVPGAVSKEAEPVAEHASTEESPATQELTPELEPIGSAKPTTFGLPQTEVMGELVADLEASLGEDFLKGAPVTEPVSAVEPEIASASAPPQTVQIPAMPLSASAAAASSGAVSALPQIQAAAAQPAISALPQPASSPVVAGATPAQSSPFGESAGVDLAEMFGELKQDLESGAANAEEDPETHYNLGIAFREMGLLDEAIGELQKTCQSIDHGHPFPQAMQTYTWLAQCFLDKGVPQAAIRWYDKALATPGIDEETRTALHYELAAAYEASGDKPSALKHFMEVYGRNIDYRDVAERIKPLKS
ncbi:MAG: tetratricopeptide repeat protein [Candidatus Sulfotelmatobacter sp.]